MYPASPVPLWLMRGIRRLGTAPDVLSPEIGSTDSPAGLLHNSFLRSYCGDRIIGGWALDVTAINFLETEIRNVRPQSVIEFGSGFSTVCLAQFMRELHGISKGALVFSVEEKWEYFEKTLSMLKVTDLESLVQVVHAPLRSQRVDDLETVCYDLFPILPQLLGPKRPDFCLIDGPNSTLGSRCGTLPLVRKFLAKNARFYMDDALRDEEIDIACRWARLAGLKVDGIALLARGMLRGTVNCA